VTGLLLLHRFCSIPICLLFLSFALLVSLAARDWETARKVWAVIKEAITVILKGAEA
jgi:hypothetical protein